VPTKSGYSFVNWQVMIGGSGYYYSPGQTITMPAQNITLTAQWGANHQITYSAPTATGGTVPVDSNYYAIGATITLANNTGSLVRAGYMFVGWQYSGSNYAVGATITLVSGQYTVYAVWSGLHYITYYGNGNTSGTAPVDSNVYYVPLNGSVFSFTAKNRGDLTRTGYYFLGWSASSGATVPTYYEGETYTRSTSLGAYAVWVGNVAISVSAYPVAGGTVTGGGTYAPGDTATVIASVNAGYSFVGWYLDDVEVSTSASYAFTVSDSVSLVAKFLDLNKLEISADRTTVYVAVGSTETVNVTSNIVGTEFTVAEGGHVTVDSSGIVTITGACPAGYQRVQIMATYGSYVGSVSIDVFTATPALSAITGRERVTIFNEDGGYVSFADDSLSRALSNLSEIRYEEDAPRKATVTLTNNWTIDEDNIRSSSFAGWSDGYVGPIKEGMQIVIDKLDTLQNVQVRVINTTIQKISTSGVTVVLTAYDALLALSEFRNPFLLYGSYVEEQSYDLDIIGSNYDYTMIADVNTLIGASLIDTIMDQATFSGSPNVMNTTMWAFSFDSSHGPSNVGGIHKIRRLRAHIIESANLSYRVKIFAGDTLLGGPMGTPVFESALYVATSGSVVDHAWNCDYIVYPGDYLYYAIEVINSTIPSQSVYYGTSSKFESDDFWVYNYGGVATGWKKVGVSVNPGNTIWPTVEVEYEDTPRVIDISSVTISGANIIVVPDSIAVNSAYDSAIAIIATFFSSGRPASTMVSDLIRRAGLYTDGLATPTKSLAYYDTSSYDYLTCVQDLIGAAADSGSYQGSLMTVQASVTYPRMILCRYKHRLIDTPYKEITTAPFGVGNKIVRSHTLQRTFETETSRPILLSTLETNGTPIALQTDDLLYGSASLEERLGYKTITITTDNTLQTHAALSMSAEAMIKKAHRNTLEGQAVLSKVTPLFWSQDGDAVYGAGKVLTLDIPQYGASTNAITRIMTIKGYFTTLDLDNVRLDNRTILNQSITRGQDAQTYSIATLPSAAYIFVRLEDVISSNVGDYVSVELVDATDDIVGTSSIIRLTTDNASPDATGGYVHVSALFDVLPAGYATTAPIKYIYMHTTTQTYVALITEPVYAWPGQYVHVSVRGRRT
ncbi:MAG: InlB B-repeat-containing protein, partial [Candidatus Nanoarchaeia archaeon]